MQLRLWIAIIIFMGSYFPLSLILLAQDYKMDSWSKQICFDIFSQNTTCSLPFSNPKLSISIFLICLVSVFATGMVLRLTKGSRKARVENSRYVPAELMNYTLPYVVSFMGIGYNEENKFIGIIIFIVWIFWITHKSGQIILNPILVVFGWRLYEATIKYDGDSREYQCMALSKKEFLAGDRVVYSSIQDVLVLQEYVEN